MKLHKMKRASRRGMLALLAAAMLLSIGLSACSKSESGNNAPSGGPRAVSEGDKPVPITLFAHEWQQYDGADKDRVWEEIEQRTNTEITLVGAPYNGYQEKLNIMVNAGDAPDIFFVMPGNEDAYIKWVEQGIAIPLDDYLTEEIAPHATQLFSYDTYKYLKTGGHYTVVPWLSPANNWGIYIRRDWLDNVGLPMPKTLDDYYNVFRAFTFEDPDRNNKQDTYGLAGSSGTHWFMPFYAAFVSKPDWNWNADQSEVEYFLTTEEYKQYLVWMNKLYSEGLIARDWYQRQDDDKLNDFQTGKTGIMVHNAETHVQAIVDNTLQAQPNAVVAMAEPPVGPSGEASIHGWGGHWGGYTISNNARNPEAAMRLLDFLIGPEGTKLRLYGVEGVHYTVGSDGQIVPNVEERLKEPMGRFGLVEQDGEQLPLGQYAWGPWFGTDREYGESGISVFTDNSTSKYPELVDNAQTIVNQYVRSSDLNNISISDQEFADISKRVRDLAATYTTLIIVGEKDVEAGWAEYMRKLEEVKYGKAKQIATEFVNNLE